MQAKISKRVVDSAAATGADLWVWDTELKGFGLRVRPNGHKAYVLEYRAGAGGRNAQKRRVTIGQHGSPWAPDTARDEAKRLLGLVTTGADPAAELKAAREPKAGETVREAVDLFLARYGSRLRSVDAVRGLFERDVLPRWGTRKTADIAKRDVIELIDQIVDSGRPVQANRIFSAVRRFFNWAVERDIITTSPCAGVKAPTAEESRDRVLEDDELRRVWAAAAEMAYPFGPWVQLLVLTAQRRDEVAGMRWRELDLDAGLWVIPKERAKNDKAHEVPLSPGAVEILQGLPRLGPDDFVFTTTGRAPISGYSKAKAALDRRIVDVDPEGERLAPWTYHDIRRTVTTGLARMGIPPHVVDRILNHVQGSIRGVAAVYNRHDYIEERRRALEAWERHVLAVIKGGTAAGNVVKLPVNGRKAG